MFHNTVQCHSVVIVDFENLISSSAYRIMSNRILSNSKILPRSVFSIRSLINNTNKSGELVSPCFNPVYELKESEYVELYLLHALTTSYTVFNALTNSLLTFS